jgi:uncharacterized protein YcfL
MKTYFASLLVISAALAVSGCRSTYDRGPYLPQQTKAPSHEATQPVVLMDPGVQYSITLAAPPHARMLEDGRMEVTVQLRNRENRRIEVQANCVWKDVNGVGIGDETPFQTVILGENATEQVQFVSANNRAQKYTVRVRQAR